MTQKKNITIFILVIIFFAIGCDNNFSPYAEFEKNYAINCILNPNDSIQTLVLLENISPTTIIDETNISSLIVNDAVVRIWYNDEVVRFKQSKGENKIPEVKEGYYYVKNLPIIKGTKYKLEAILENIHKVKSELVVPDSLSINKQNTSFQIPSKGNEPGGANNIRVGWFYDNKYNLSTVKFTIFYKHANSDIVERKHIPHNIVIRDNKVEPIYAKPQRTGEINLSLTTFDKFFDEWKKEIFFSNYKLLALGYEIIVYDKNLTEFYFSVINHKESVSVVIDDYNASIIQGGYGVFGCFIKMNGAIPFTNEFKRKYGFITEIE